VTERGPEEARRASDAELEALIERFRVEIGSYRWAADQRSRLVVEHLFVRSPGIRGMLLHPVKLLIRRMLRWYVEGLAEEQRRFNLAVLKLTDELAARVAQLERRTDSAEPSRKRTTERE
jgi:hypothetical protein